MFSPHIEIFPAPSPFPPPLNQILRPQSLRSSRCLHPWSVSLTLYSPTISCTISGYRASLPKNPVCSSLHDPYRFVRTPPRNLGFPGGSVVKNPPAVQEMGVRSLGQEDPLQEGLATHSNILAGKTPWTERGAWWTIVHGVAKNQTWLRNWAPCLGMLNGQFFSCMKLKRDFSFKKKHFVFIMKTSLLLWRDKSRKKEWSAECHTNKISEWGAILKVAFCDSMDCSPPGFSVSGILQARILDWVAISFSRGSSWPRIEPGSPALQVDSLPSEL